MAKTRPFTVLFSQQQAEMLIDTAANEGVTISEFLRGRILAREDLEQAFGNLQSTLLAVVREGFQAREDTIKPGEQGEAYNPQVLGMLAEVLLLLRAASNPGKMQAVKAEVQRLGYEPFTK